jgi:hypothetical protein
MDLILGVAAALIVAAPIAVRLFRATAEANDGWISYSKHRRGTASWHGGVKNWINRPLG